jgi:hypothetical protein
MYFYEQTKTGNCQQCRGLSCEKMQRRALTARPYFFCSRRELDLLAILGNRIAVL